MVQSSVFKFIVIWIKTFKSWLKYCIACSVTERRTKHESDMTENFEVNSLRGYIWNYKPRTDVKIHSETCMKQLKAIIDISFLILCWPQHLAYGNGVSRFLILHSKEYLYVIKYIFCHYTIRLLCMQFSTTSNIMIRLATQKIKWHLVYLVFSQPMK